MTSQSYSRAGNVSEQQQQKTPLPSWGFHPSLCVFSCSDSSLFRAVWVHGSEATVGLKHWLLFLTEKAMAPHSSTLAWKIPGPRSLEGCMQSMGSLRVGHDWATSLSLFPFMHWRRKWQPTPVFLPGESQGWGSLVGCHLWGCTELDTTEAT